MLKELFVPLGFLAVLASMLLPVAPEALDFLLVGNLILALTLFVSAFYIVEPLKLSALPSMLLLATLLRLSLNIATTRAILSRGDAGQVVEAFGLVVAQGNLVVGLIIFLVISLVQFIVVAKGSERVAEVAARFTLDALPGKQMSIDADVRAGLIDLHAAREKRQELQIESRFYGALDGAMKFVKGDAIAGLIIVGINLCGGFIIGIVLQGLDLSVAASKYSILTIGDGLLSQIPSLLNALAAGIVVTRVARGDNQSLANELVMQLGQERRVKVIIALLALALSVLSGLPTLPFLICALGLFLSALLHKPGVYAGETSKISPFLPRTPSLFEVSIGTQIASHITAKGSLSKECELFRARMHDQYGLVLVAPDIKCEQIGANSYTIRMRGIVALQQEISPEQKEPLSEIFSKLEQLVQQRREELVDDILTRRTLDCFDMQAPELVAAVVPTVISVTQLSEVLRALCREQISIKNFDQILQAISESAGKAVSERAIVEEVRIALRRVICAMYANSEGRLRAITLDPILDMALTACEREKHYLDPRYLDLISAHVASPEIGGAVVVCSKGARRLLHEALQLRALNIPVLAHEEIVAEVKLDVESQIILKDEGLQDEMLERLAA